MMSPGELAASNLNLRLELNQLDSPHLMRDYNLAVPQLAPFFAGCPWDAASIQRVAAGVRTEFPDATRRAMMSAIRPTSESAHAKLERISSGEGFFVTTGQQAGLFTGPLFSIYKTLTAVKLAASLEALLQVPVAPLFWIAGDDHDFEEVNHAYVLGAENDLQRIAINAESDVPRSMNRALLGESVESAVTLLAQVLPSNEFSKHVIASIREHYTPGKSVAAAFGGLFASLFSGFDLLITSSADPTVKSLAAPVIRLELDQSAEHEAAVRAQTQRLVAAGYHEQVGVREGAVNVLYEDEEGRDRLVRAAEGWHLSRTKRRMNTVELHELLAHHPERFSPNVLLRPIVASAVFPTLAYVGGPAEVSYFAQIGCLFEAHNVVMPLFMPRASVDVIEYKIQKVLDKYGLQASAFRQPFDQLASQMIRDALPESISGRVASLNGQIVSGYADLVAATQSIDPTLRGPLEAARTASEKALGDVEKKIVSHLKKKNEIGVEQLRKASMNLFPEGQSQERVISGVSYLARYGDAFIAAVASRIDFELDVRAPAWDGVHCS